LLMASDAKPQTNKIHMKDRGRLSPPLPPNRKGGSPAYGSPVSGYPFGIDRLMHGLRLM